MQQPTTKNPSFTSLNIEPWLRENNIWYRLSENVHVGSCEEAAAARLRNNARGIPVHDELKTLVMQTDDGRVFLVHARGHRQIDFNKVADLVDVSHRKKIRMLQDEQLLNMFGARYGLVNPISVARQYGPLIAQVFDREVSESGWSEEETMMTNAGEHIIGVEFRPNEIIDFVHGTIQDIIET